LLEIAAEPGAGIFGPERGAFANLETRRLGDALAPPPRAAVFANEWLDAQPFHRLVFRRGAWRELGVCVEGESLRETELPNISESAKILLKDLPADAPEDYHFDISLDAETRLRELAGAAWHGGVMLADYGHDWATLARERPAGTARAYSKHEVSGNVLARPGEQDLTCHVCWDRLENILREHGFTDVRVERQEAFFVRLAAQEIEKILAPDAGQFSVARQTLLELLHPAHLGQKFQILSARRIA
jgi:SAM-dependent MidA family methyltransferase